MLNAAIRNCKEIKVLSRPQITTVDNQSAYVKVGGDPTHVFSARITSRVMPEGGVLTRIEAGVKGSSESAPEMVHTTAKTRDGGTIVVRMANSPGKESEKSEILSIMTLHVVRN
jgi:hypothetical protein